jgi:hypothetical protein
MAPTVVDGGGSVNIREERLVVGAHHEVDQTSVAVATGLSRKKRT